MACQLVTGDTQYSIQAGQYLSLTNSTAAYIQISSIQGIESGSSTFGEYCASLDSFSNDQLTPGTGQVGCAAKDSGSTYPPIVWNDSAEPTALQVPPGHTVYVNPGAVGIHPFQFIVSAQPQTWGVQAWRQPRADPTGGSIACNGTQQSTVWSPWQNTTGAPLYLRGAYIYAVSGTSTPNHVQNAALYILDTSGNVRFSYFPNVNLRNTVAISPPQTVQPGEYIAAQAINTCPAPAGWNWAAYMYVSTG